MPLFIDQLNRKIELNNRPKRIISLVPSQTELLADLHLENEVAGITKFCIHPERWFRNKQRVGGTKNINREKIRSLKPDLIIANKEENVREQIEELATEFPVWISDVNTLDDALEMIEAVGKITGKEDEAMAIKTTIIQQFSPLSAANEKLRTAYLIWKDPYMTVGGDTFIHDMLTKAAFANVFASQNRYPEMTIEALREAGCELLLLSSEPYPFKQKHIEELQELLPQTKIMLVDGEMFSWYGSRLTKAPTYFQALRHQIKAIV